MACTLSSRYHSGPVTALMFWEKDILIAGIGSSLHFYSLRDGEGLLLRVEALTCRNIHGIRNLHQETEEHPCLSCCFGEKSIRVWNYDCPGNRVIFHCKLWECEDLIWDVTWLNDKDDPILALGLGHNTVILWDWKTTAVLERVQCEEVCIIYCAHFIGHWWSELILAAGTVFNQVVLWSVNTRDFHQGRSPVLHRLQGHEGVIFDIDYHWELQRLCSVSDDRSIHLWQATGPSGDWAQTEFTLLRVLYGHSARVWSVCMLLNKLISVGEDSTCCVWDYDGNIIQKYKGHRGKSIWSLSVDREGKFVATGGGDHSIRLWKLQQEHRLNTDVNFENLSPPQLKKEDFPRTVTLRGHDRVLVMTNMGDLFEFIVSTGTWTTLLEDPEFRSYSVLSVSPERRVIALGSINGKITLIILKEKTTERVFEKCYKGKVLSINWLDQESLLTCGPEGIMHMWRLTIQEDQCLTGSSTLEVMASYILPPTKQRWVTAACFTPSRCQFVCGDRGGNVYVYQIDNTQTKDSQESALQFKSGIHGKAGVTFVSCHGNSVYTCGRNGIYYEFEVDESGLAGGKSNKVLKGFDWMDRLVITDNDILILGFHSSDFIIWSTQRNQRLVQIECGGGHRTWGCEISDMSAVRFVFLKASDIFLCSTTITCDQTILKSSLHGRELSDVKHLVSTTHRDQKFEVFLTCSEDTNITLSSVISSTSQESRLSVLRNLKGHISSVRTMAVSESRLHDCDTKRTFIMFSAGGRAQMKAWKIVVSMKTNEKELGGGDNRAPVSSASMMLSADTSLKPENRREEKRQTTSEDLQNKCVIRKEETKSCFKDVCHVESNYELLASHMLHDRVKRRSKSWQRKLENTSPETRYMDLTAFHGHLVDTSLPSSIHFVGAACSDAVVRFFLCDADKKMFTCLGLSLENNCVLKVGHFVHHMEGLEHCRVFLFSCSTGGDVTFWDVTKTVLAVKKTAQPSASEVKAEQFKSKLPDAMCTEDSVNPDFCSPVHVFQNHQSGVNSISVHQYTDRLEWLMVTGGDDNAVVFRTFTISLDGTGRVHFTPLLKCDLPSAHSAQVTGAKILDDHYTLTVSIDQRLCLWEVTQTDKSLKAEMRACKFVSVADVSNMDVWKQRSGSGYDIAISGEGLQILHLNLPS
ncbi:tRNA (34-2'-O)-methyltransferase regulator WDR6-like [Liolophura sinensis]|uniref:tRNA (34-2'-O)-methyltransferase regulator WDR6-like n=1 Tax=Liolophura sinensis TaxID=3198878 RepID=UPI0031581453